MDAITLLRQDHKTVEKLFKQFEKAKDARTRKAVVQEIVRELAVHAAIEEQGFYPAVRRAAKTAEQAGMDELDFTVLEGLEEHHLVKVTLAELEKMPPGDERYVAKVTVLMESVRHHVEEEESEMFPAVRSIMGRTALRELGDAMEQMKKVSPTRPHPSAPDEPPFNIAANLGAAITDRAKDALTRGGRRKASTRG